MTFIDVNKLRMTTDRGLTTKGDIHALCNAYDEAIDFIQSIAFTKISYNQYAITNPKAVAWLEDHVLLRDTDTIFSDKESKL